MALQTDLQSLRNATVALTHLVAIKTQTYNDLQALDNALGSTDSILYRQDFKSRPDADRIVVQLAALAKATMANLQSLQEFLMNFRQSDRSSGYESQSQDPARFQEIRYSLLKHTSAFQKVGDLVGRRDDQANLSPKVTNSLEALDAPKFLDTRGTLGTKVSVSCPPSPYQPTVEDFGGSSDEEVEPNVEFYHHVPPEEPSSPFEDSGPLVDDDSKAPPRLILRTATDLSQVGSSHQSPVVDSPRKASESHPSPLQSSSGADFIETAGVRESDDRGGNDPGERVRSSEPSRGMTKIERSGKTVEELQAEMNRLQTEMEALQADRIAIQTTSVRRGVSRRRHQLSMDSQYPRPREDYPHQDIASGRSRSSTAVGADRPRSYHESSSSDNPVSRILSERSRASPGRSTRRPSQSPRLPFIVSEPKLDKYGPQDPPDQGYGFDPRTSIPSVMGAIGLERRSRRNTSTRGHRMSGFADEAEVFREFVQHRDDFGEDFPLFDNGPSSSNLKPKSGSPMHSLHPASPPSMLQQAAIPESENIVEPTVRELPVTLEELFDGTTKKVRVRRQRYNTHLQRFVEEERILEVPIYKGLKPGSKIKYPTEGDETINGMKELHFILIEKSHPTFTRNNYDLHMAVDITLLDALCGWQRTVTSICGKTIKVSHAGPTQQAWQEAYAGLGMCSHKNENQRGDLIVGVMVRYPGSLSERQKSLLREALGGR